MQRERLDQARRTGSRRQAASFAREQTWASADATVEEITAARLRLGSGNGGGERSGAANLSYVVYNHGTDTLPAGSNVNIYLSRDKTLSRTDDLLIRMAQTPLDLNVASAARFTSQNQAPPSTIFAVDSMGMVLIDPARYYLIFDLNPSGNESGDALTDNVLVHPETPLLMRVVVAAVV